MGVFLLVGEDGLKVGAVDGVEVVFGGETGGRRRRQQGRNEDGTREDGGEGEGE